MLQVVKYHDDSTLQAKCIVMVITSILEHLLRNLDL